VAIDTNGTEQIPELCDLCIRQRPRDDCRLREAASIQALGLVEVELKLLVSQVLAAARNLADVDE